MVRDSVAFRIIRGFSKICQRSAVFACRREQIRTDDKLSATAGDAANGILGTELFTDGEAKQRSWSAPLDCIQRKRTSRVGGEALSWGNSHLERRDVAVKYRADQIFGRKDQNRVVGRV